MGCNCGKRRTKPNKAASKKYALETPDGKTQHYGSRLEAEADFVRNGRTGSIRKVK